MSEGFRYRLGLDLGASSLGWCLVRLNQQNAPVALVKLGVRIFSDGRNPKDGSSLAVTRRMARQMRRRRDRLLKRKTKLADALIRLNFFPSDEVERKALANLNPYILRQKGLDEALTPAEFARALFHINQRRGFKSNRKTNKNDNDGGKLKTAIRRVHEELQSNNARTIGEWLADRHTRRESVRARLRGSTKKEQAYDLYIDRAMVEAEFDALWSRQSELQPERFNQTSRDVLKDILLYQRPLKPVVPGRCTLNPEEERAPVALPSVQRFRIYQEVNHLRLMEGLAGEAPLTLEQRDSVVDLLEKKSEVSFIAIRRALGIGGGQRFTLEDAEGRRDRLKGNATSAQLSRKELFGPDWHAFTPDKQETIAEKLINEQSESALIDWLVAETGIDDVRAERIANASLPDGFGNLGRTAIGKVLPELQAAVITYDKAVIHAGYDSHSALSHSESTGEIMRALPYYGEALQRHVGFGSGRVEDSPEMRYGRIANPTVHIGLNQVRQVVNAIIGRYGNPAEIVIEVARDLKLGQEKKAEIRRDQAERQKQNDRWREEIRKIKDGMDATAEDMLRMRLWTELNPTDAADRRCPYTGEQISLGMLFSDAVEIEHILPFSRTLDDSLNNKTVALRRANRDKGNRTPFEAFGHSPEGYVYQNIQNRALSMPGNKAKRFAPDGYEKWLKEDKSFLARALNDTAYLSRVAREYLSLVCPARDVRAVPGRMTAMLRGFFGLNSLLSGSAVKNRDDHRHHAVDAAVIAITDQGLLQRFATASASAREKQLRRLVENMEPPWQGYRDQVGAAIARCRVSHKPDHGHEGGLHNDTAYSLLPEGRVSHRVFLSSFSSDKEIEKTEFASPLLKEWLLEQTRGLSGKEFAAKLDAITRDFRHRRVKIVEKLNVLQIANRDGKPYKGYKGDSNHCIEIVGNDKGKWQGEVISTFDAYRIDAKEKGRLRHSGLSQSGKPLVMRLCIDDTVMFETEGVPVVYRVASIRSNGVMSFAPIHEANVDARNRDKEESFSYVSKTAGSLQAAKGRRVTISPLGMLNGQRHFTG